MCACRCTKFSARVPTFKIGLDSTIVLNLVWQCARGAWGYVYLHACIPVRLDLQAGPRGLHERRAASLAQRSFSLDGISSSRLIRKSENPNAKTCQIY